VGLKKRNYLDSMSRDRREAEDFTQMLFYLHQADAAALASHLDLSDRRAVLDVGGGSGVMSIALVNKNPHLTACILDIAPVCEIAARNVKRARLSRRVRTLAGDIRQSLPGIRCRFVLRYRGGLDATSEKRLQKPARSWAGGVGRPLSHR